ncbi:RiPP maturation radical SAM C-methyltransferase [Acidobacteriota bacterium]
MKRMALINMPFGAIHMPSPGLTQLKYLLDKRFKSRFFTDVSYLNHDFARYLGNDMIYLYTLSIEGLISGIGDWFFRQAAFPDLADNTEIYMRRYFPKPDANIRMLLYTLLERRRGLDNFLAELVDKYDLAGVGIVGFTSLFVQNTASFAMARKIKERNKNIVIVMGGPSCEGAMGYEIVKNVDSIDYVFSGPALISFPEFVQYYDEGKRELCDGINGVFSKKNYMFSRFHTNTNARAQSPPDDTAISPPWLCVGDYGEELDINTDIELDYTDFLDSFTTHCTGTRLKPEIMFETSRGCWWGERCQCTFCGLNGSKIHYRAKKPENAIKAIKSLYKYTHRVKVLKSTDNVIPKFFIKDVLPYLDIPQDVRIYFEIRADLQDEDLRALSQQGVKYMQAGIESLATSTLKLMRKGTTAFQNIMLLKNSLKNELHVSWNLLIGFPGEDEEVYKKYIHDIPLLMHLPPPDVLSPMRFDRYSYYFNNPEEFGLDLHPYDFYELIYPFDKKSLNNFAYYFIDYKGNADYVIKLNKWHGQIAEKCSQWRKRWQYDSKPGLTIKKRDDRLIVYDSRPGQAAQYQISDAEYTILKVLEKPHRFDELTDKITSLSTSDLTANFKHLQDKGLLFQENDRFLSLLITEAERQLFVF